jgi:O-antigen biosynthesis protein WbqP
MKYYPSGKRLLDLFIVLPACLILSPIFLFTSLCIKLFDPGPIIFRQKRVGRDGELFDFYKFRSMPLNTGDLPSDQVGKVQLTWIGKFIRRTNIDELPQLFNIFKGDMSIVGPRPPISSQLELIELRKNNGALSLTPGLTGLAQISSFDGMSIAEKAHFDGLYAKDVRFFADVSIILRTFLYLIKPPPVY